MLELGNALNEGTPRGAARGYRLDILTKLSFVKSADRKTDLLRFIASVVDDPEKTPNAAKKDDTSKSEEEEKEDGSICPVLVFAAANAAAAATATAAPSGCW